MFWVHLCWIPWPNCQYHWRWFWFSKAYRVVNLFHIIRLIYVLFFRKRKFNARNWIHGQMHTARNGDVTSSSGLFTSIIIIICYDFLKPLFCTTLAICHIMCKLRRPMLSFEHAMHINMWLADNIAWYQYKRFISLEDWYLTIYLLRCFEMHWLFHDRNCYENIWIFICSFYHS